MVEQHRRDTSPDWIRLGCSSGPKRATDLAREPGTDGAHHDMVIIMERTTGTVREWHAELAWGVLDPRHPWGRWAHFSHIDRTGFRALTVGAAVRLDWEPAQQDGYAFRATRIQPLDE